MVNTIRDFLLKDWVLIVGGLAIVVVFDELGKKGIVSLYVISYLVLPIISYYLVTKYGKKYGFEHLRMWQGAAILVSFLILPILYWRAWREKSQKNCS